MKCLFVLLSVILLVSCGRNPMWQPGYRECGSILTEEFLQKQKRLLDVENGNWDVFVNLQDYFSRCYSQSNKQMLIEFMDRNPDYFNKVIDGGKRKIEEMATPNDVMRYVLTIKTAQQIDVFPIQKLEDLQKFLYDQIERKNRSSEIDFQTDDSVTRTPPFLTSEHQQIVFKRTLAWLYSNDTTNISQVKSKCAGIDRYLNGRYSSELDRNDFMTFVSNSKFIDPCNPEKGLKPLPVSNWQSSIDESELRDFLIQRTYLKDPFSAKFRKVTKGTISKPQNIIWCGEMNTKIPMGGYGGWSLFYAYSLDDKHGLAIAEGEDISDFKKQFIFYCGNAHIK